MTKQKSFRWFTWRFIDSSRHSVVTPYISAQLFGVVTEDSIGPLYVEYVIHVLQIFRVIGNLFRYRRRTISI